MEELKMLMQTILITTMLLTNCNSIWAIEKNINKEHNMQVEFDSTSINYTRKGTGETVLLFIHGWCINSTYWEKQQEYFSSKYETIALDLPGFGKSIAIRENWTIEEYSKDIIRFINHLELKNVILIGHSMAGEIVLETALTNHPSIKGIIGIDNFKMIDVQFTAEQIEQMNGFMKMLENDFANMAPAYAERFLLSPATDESVAKRIKSDFANADAKIGFLSFSNYVAYTLNESDKLRNLNYKLHLLNSNYTPTNIQGLEKNCKNSFEVYEMQASSHYPMIENHIEFNRQLQKIINQI